MTDRGRTTVSDVLVYLFAAAAVAGLYPVASDLVASAPLARGPELVITTVFPALALVFLAVIYLKAGIGPS